MSDIYTELEIIQTSLYCNIIENMLYEHDSLSTLKLSFFAFIYKKNRFNFSNVYTANNANDLTLKGVSMAMGHFENYCENLKYILGAIDLLINAQKIEIIHNELYSISIPQQKYELNPFLKLAVEDSKKMSDSQFLKEIIRNV